MRLIRVPGWVFASDLGKSSYPVRITDAIFDPHEETLAFIGDVPIFVDTRALAAALFQVEEEEGE